MGDHQALQAPFTVSEITERLKRDEIGLNPHRALEYCLIMNFPENRYTLFRILL